MQVNELLLDLSRDLGDCKDMDADHAAYFLTGKATEKEEQE